MVTGAVALAEFAHVVAEKYPVNVALHTDHCPKDKLDGYVRPLIAISQERVDAGPGAAVPVAHVGRLGGRRWTRTCRSPRSCWRSAPRRRSSWRSRSASSAARRTASSARSTRSSTPPPATSCAPPRRSGSGEKGRYLLAATFGNVHGVYKPGNVKLRPGDPQARARTRRRASSAPRTSRSTWSSTAAPAPALEEIREAVSYGVVKMNVDTDTQYAFTRPIAGHMFTNYDGVLKVDGEVGNKKAYDPRSYIKLAEAGMAARVVEACEDLLSAGKSQAG